jgi:hypothetical protein
VPLEAGSPQFTALMQAAFTTELQAEWLCPFFERNKKPGERAGVMTHLLMISNL